MEAEAVAGRRGVSYKVMGYVELLRLHNVFVAAVTTLIGFLLACRVADVDPIGVIGVYIVSAGVVGLIAAGGYVINDYYDIDIDTINKPWRPIPSGRVSPREAYILSLTLFASGAALAVALGVLAFVYALLVSVLLYEYSRRLKRMGFVGNVVVAFNSASTILYGGLAVAEQIGRLDVLLPVLVPAVYAFLLVLAREVVKGVEDYHGDRAGSAKTLAVVLGPRRAAIIASAMLVGVAFISPIPWLAGWYGGCYISLAAIVAALSVASAAALIAANDVVKEAARPRRLLKWAFFVGALAFIAGTFC